MTIVYESMFGATRQVAETIADQLRPFADITIVNSANADPTEIMHTDLFVAGGPTHVFGLSSEATREEARKVADRSDAALVFEWPDVTRGLREMLRSLPRASRPQHFAAFSTRSAKAPRLFTGSAARRIVRDIRAAGYLPLVAPRDFLIDAGHRLVEGQLSEAADWGAQLAGHLNLLRERQLAADKGVGPKTRSSDAPAL
ncbi:flavodoxin domain-containing protein [Herbiconiux sp. VKM Ac-1786]|uniref:flavodoxin family protein n=1 Tax=Herbiconiux sp. VKM Ac-1786 TaxID=2783824 RepID=UPI00188CDD1A|nr:flavodoxin domain-containing protein [Herbiconiux sp. VKM Ac-1786]